VNKRMVVVVLSILYSGPPSLIPASSFPPAELSVTKLVERIHEKILSVPEIDHWQASVLATLFEMDKNWEPKKKVIIKKIAQVENKIRKEEILSATEYEEDKITDMTAKYQAETARFNERNESGNGKDGQRGAGRHRGLDLNRDELFPFGQDRRAHYEFRMSPPARSEDQEVYILETRSRQRSSSYFEGKYYVHPQTFDVLRAELRPARNPGPLKMLEMDIGFERLPDGYLIIRTARVRIHVGLIIKNIRLESEEIYSDYRVFH